MSALSFVGLSQSLTRHGDMLLRNTCDLSERVSTYWGNKKELNSQISVKINERELEISIPQFRFSCSSESRLTLHEGSLMGEIAFFTFSEGKKNSFHKVFIDRNNCMCFTTPNSEPLIDTDYAENVEHIFMNALIDSAIAAKLI